MQITRLGHSCLLVEDGNARLLIDPGTYSNGFEDLTGLTGILITHQHADHLDRRRFGDVLARNPAVPLYTDPQTASILKADDIPAHAVAAGDTLPGMGVEVSVHGQTHAVVHPDIPTVDNVSYLIGGRLLHPGDALLVPEVPVQILALPAVAPWMAVKEAIDYHRAVGAAHAFPIHTALASQAGLALYLRLLEGMGPADCTFHDPGPGHPLSL
jgi:L-ascorbate metabolism protein UlaG (beta-lactamase superfamily)